MIIGRSDFSNSKDRVIYTDPITNRVVVKSDPIEGISHVRVFVDKYIRKNVTTTMAANSSSKKKVNAKGIFPPKYILKMVNDRGVAEVNVYYCKNQLFADMIESWGACDLIL